MVVFLDGLVVFSNLPKRPIDGKGVGHLWSATVANTGPVNGGGSLKPIRKPTWREIEGREEDNLTITCGLRKVTELKHGVKKRLAHITKNLAKTGQVGSLVDGPRMQLVRRSLAN
jgi:hypothetical protein